MKKIIFVIVKLSVSAALLIYLLSDIQWRQMSEAFYRLSPWSLALMLGLYLLAQGLSSLRWQLICQSLQLSVTWRYLLNLYFLGMFFNLFLPTGVGGDAVKSYALGKTSHSQLKAAHSVLFDRISGLMAMLLLALIALMMIKIEPAWISSFIVTITLGGLAVLLTVPKFVALLAGRYPKFGEYLSPAILLYRDYRRVVLFFLLALVIQTLGFVIVVGLGHALGIHLSLAFYVVSWTAITLMTLVPISINGIGVREAGFVYLFRLEGVPAELAMTLGILTFAIPACASLLGVVPLLHSGFKAR